MQEIFSELVWDFPPEGITEVASNRERFEEIERRLGILPATSQSIPPSPDLSEACLILAKDPCRMVRSHWNGFSDFGSRMRGDSLHR